jgi:23S rRNA (cytosine1962-C5)-methyltransferase
MDKIILKSGREKSLKRHHPWVFSGAIQRIDGNPGMGDTIEVVSAGGEIMGCAAFSPQSSIRARMWNYGETMPEDLIELISNKMRIAIYKRINFLFFNSSNNSIRLIHAESDGLPGLVVDQYSHWLVVQCLSTGPEKWKTFIVEKLAEITGLKNIYERSDVDVRTLEGLPETSGLLCP